MFSEVTQKKSWIDTWNIWKRTFKAIKFTKENSIRNKCTETEISDLAKIIITARFKDQQTQSAGFVILTKWLEFLWGFKRNGALRACFYWRPIMRLFQLDAFTVWTHICRFYCPTRKWAKWVSEPVNGASEQREGSKAERCSASERSEWCEQTNIASHQVAN